MDSAYPDELAALAARGIACVELELEPELRPKEDARALRRLRAELRRQRPHVLHLHSSKAGGVGRLASLFVWPRPRVIYTPHAMAAYRSRFYLWLERGLGVLTDTLVAVSASEARDFVGWRIPGARRAVTLTMGVRPPGGQAPPQVPALASPQVPALAPPQDPAARPFLVGACGRICYQKDAELFFDLALSMRDDHRFAFRWIGDFGDDAEAARVRARLEDAGWPANIEVTGWVPDPERHLGQLDAFCMFSRYESFGYVTAEAMALGVPVVGTVTTGTVDLIRPEETGLLVDRDLRSIRASLSRLAADPALRGRLAANARRMVADRYTIGRMIAEAERLYLGLADARRLAPAGDRKA
jgi:glycosyltransferase involved in cell wall biosynthesis